jgi:hypothetical protein
MSGPSYPLPMNIERINEILDVAPPYFIVLIVSNFFSIEVK